MNHRIDTGSPCPRLARWSRNGKRRPPLSGLPPLPDPDIGRELEVEHAVDRAGDGVERATGLDALPGEPVVLDELEDRGLVGQRVVDEALLREGRRDQQ